jgi:hypothetical protein
MLAMAARKKSTGGRPKAADPKRSLVSLKGGAKYAEWFDGLVAHMNLSPTVVMELGLRELAAKHGYSVPQPKR